MKHSLILGALVPGLLISAAAHAQNIPVERFSAGSFKGSAVREETRSEKVPDSLQRAQVDRFRPTKEAFEVINRQLHDQGADVAKASKMEVIRPSSEAKESSCRGGDDSCGKSQMDPGGDAMKGMNAQSRSLALGNLKADLHAQSIKGSVPGNKGKDKELTQGSETRIGDDSMPSLAITPNDPSIQAMSPELKDLVGTHINRTYQSMMESTKSLTGRGKAEVAGPSSRQGESDGSEGVGKLPASFAGTLREALPGIRQAEANRHRLGADMKLDIRATSQDRTKKSDQGASKASERDTNTKAVNRNER
jgi:hypothetical protein